jgi:hypothetical protein
MKVDINVILNLSCSEKVDNGKEENVLISIEKARIVVSTELLLYLIVMDIALHLYDVNCQ